MVAAVASIAAARLLRAGVSHVAAVRPSCVLAVSQSSLAVCRNLATLLVTTTAGVSAEESVWLEIVPGDGRQQFDGGELSMDCVLEVK